MAGKSFEKLSKLVTGAERAEVRRQADAILASSNVKKPTNAYCDTCRADTLQHVVLYNPDVPKEGIVWQCSVCGQNISWAD